MSNPAKFLITGVLGFIGQSVLHKLLARGISTIAANRSADAEAQARALRLQ